MPKPEEENRFIDDKIEHKESDIEKIQTKPNMYISRIGSAGALHLAKEIINNGIDECTNTNSPGRNVNIFVDESTNQLIVSDDGRGIPFDSLEVVCTKLQAGSKFTREGSGGSSAGENGVGMTAVNAMSDVFEIVSFRYGETGTIKFKRGEKQQDVSVRKTKDADAHGTTVVFEPSGFFLGECPIIIDDLVAWIENIIYLVPVGITIHLQAKRKGKESILRKKYQNQNGLYDYVKKLTEKTAILDPIHLMGTTTATELDKGREMTRGIGLEMSFTYNSSPSDPFVKSFCNFVDTIDHGVHVDAARSALTTFLVTKTRESLNDRDAKRLDITSADALSGMVLSVYLATEMQPHFSGQTKEKVGNLELHRPVRKVAMEQIEAYFRENPKDLKKICDYIKMNARVRYEANKARNSVVRGTTTSIDELKMSHFHRANNGGRNDYRELFLIEGESAGGTANQARSKEYQAVFGLRGVPLNAFTEKLDRVLKNNEFATLVRILKTNIGNKFDISKLYYNKIIIMTDGDIDGSRIFSLLCAFFIKHMPEVVEQGHLYKALAPLYRIKDKDTPFVTSRRDFTNVIERQIRKSIKLVNPETKVVMNSEKLKEFLFINRKYLDELTRLADHFAFDKKMIELVLLHTTIDSDLITIPNLKEIRAALKVEYPEMTLDKELVLSGVHEGQFQILPLDHIFFKRANKVHTMIHRYNEGNLFYGVMEKVGKEYVDRGNMTIGEFMGLSQKFQPDILVRYKGLGELEKEELWDTTLNPANRTLVRLTMTDLKNEVKKFDVLHGKDPQARIARKEMMEAFTIDREDLDS